MDIIIINRKKEVLLGKRTNEPAKNTWFVPGGCIRKNESFKDLANEASCQWTGNFNPRQTDHADFMNLYESAL